MNRLRHRREQEVMRLLMESGGGGVPPFAPSSLSGLQLWLDASSTTNGLSNSVPGGIYVSVTGVPTANVLNGKQVLAFSITQQIVSSPSLSSYSLFAISRQTDSIITRFRVFTSSDAANHLYGYWGGKKRTLFIDNDPSILTGLTSDTNWDQFTHTRIAGGAYTFRWNRSLVDSKSTSSTSLMNTFGINTRIGEESPCQVAEVLLYNRVLTQDEVDAIETYLHTKWDL